SRQAGDTMPPSASARTNVGRCRCPTGKRTSTERPNTRTERPDRRTERPDTRTERPDTRTERPDTRTERPDARRGGGNLFTACRSRFPPVAWVDIEVVWGADLDVTTGQH